jgi:hypothetical protein
MDLNRVRWQQELRRLALVGLNHFPTLPMWLNGQGAEETNLYYVQRGEQERYHRWCYYLKAGIFQGIALQDYEEWTPPS